MIVRLKILINSESSAEPLSEISLALLLKCLFLAGVHGGIVIQGEWKSLKETIQHTCVSIITIRHENIFQWN